MKRIEKIIGLAYAALILAMGLATVAEKFRGTEFASAHFYGSWWFICLWAVLVLASTIFIIKRLRHSADKVSVILTHSSMVVILAGALITHLTSQDGMVHLREGETSATYTAMAKGSERTASLPFKLKLIDFDVKHNPGTETAKDYVSSVELMGRPYEVSMNHILKYKGWRLYQASFDEDLKGSYLRITVDPIGVPVTYSGYLIFFIAMLWVLVSPKGRYRRIIRKFMASALLGTTVFLTSGFSAAAAQLPDGKTIPEGIASEIGRLLVNHNGRLCEFDAYSLDFLRKVSGGSDYDALTPSQVVEGIFFHADNWEGKALIKVKSKALRDAVGLRKLSSVSDFFQNGNYILNEYVQEYAEGNKDKLHKAAADVDDKLVLISTLIQEGPPFAGDRDSVKNALAYLYFCMRSGDMEGAESAIGKIRALQENIEGRPSERKIMAERLYNAVPVPTILFMLNLTVGFLLLFSLIINIISRGSLPSKVERIFSYFLLSASFLLLSCFMALRWMISGNIPMGNGYETMLLLAWLVMFFALLMIVLTRNPKSVVIPAFALMVSGFFLLVSHINLMNPAITPRMPVLNSPILSLHVSLVMMSYAMLSITFISGIAGICLAGETKTCDGLADLSRLLLYPAITCLGLGIFIGAVWANISWGTYWSWDPKETWALITFMVYAVAIHDTPLTGNAKRFHIFMILAFMSIVMTYFGVNYLLGGMHSYA